MGGQISIWKIGRDIKMNPLNWGACWGRERVKTGEMSVHIFIYAYINIYVLCNITGIHI